ncbi:hypothetical protein DSO57_1022748 [Entomophthora muscae]|uniref:Uncharacterized protein n=1 Tax=Entomophthora muscae TaxID=34485 RepID=A0ACC2TQL5_9FUNG|nr:hypothetical protein DSO57_1022748 [Entomophthora muscae]
MTKQLDNRGPQTHVNHNTGKSPYELVYGQKPTLVSTTTKPCLPLPKKVPDERNPDVQHARKDQEVMEKKRVKREAIVATEPTRIQYLELGKTAVQ